MQRVKKKRIESFGKLTRNFFSPKNDLVSKAAKPVSLSTKLAFEDIACIDCLYFRRMKLSN